MSALLDDRSCVICHDTFDGGDDGRVVCHCCRACGHRGRDHGNGMKCRRCGNQCGLDCRPVWQRGSDGWPVRFPWLAA